MLDTDRLTFGGGHTADEIQLSRAPADSLLLLLAETLDEIEDARIAAQNRYRSFASDPLGDNDSAKGLAGTREAEILKAIWESLAADEEHLIAELEAAAAAIPWVPEFIATRKGIGLKGVGRILGCIGDPAWNARESRPRRGPAELWAYCGYHTVPVGHVPRESHDRFADGNPTSASAGDQTGHDLHHGFVSSGNVRPRRRRGVKCQWNVRAKHAVQVAARSAWRQGYYRTVYLEERGRAAGKVHVVQCQNQVRPPGSANGCGTSAHPEWGAPGSPWRPGHQHQHAISMVGKQLLKDLFLEARKASA